MQLTGGSRSTYWVSLVLKPFNVSFNSEVWWWQHHAVGSFSTAGTSKLVKVEEKLEWIKTQEHILNETCSTELRASDQAEESPSNDTDPKQWKRHRSVWGTTLWTSWSWRPSWPRISNFSAEIRFSDSPRPAWLSWRGFPKSNGKPLDPGAQSSFHQTPNDSRLQLLSELLWILTLNGLII